MWAVRGTRGAGALRRLPGRVGPCRVAAGGRTLRPGLLLVSIGHGGGRTPALAEHPADGDLRRHMAADQNVLSKPLSQVMSKNPVCIHDEALAAEALKIFKEREIDDLIVVNSKRQPVGLVDLQDLPKMKIV